MMRAIGTLFFSSLISALPHALLEASVATQKPVNSAGRLAAPAPIGSAAASAAAKANHGFTLKPSHRPFALHCHPRARTRVRPVVPQRAVLGAAVVPERDRILAPAEAALEQRIFHVLVEVFQDRAALVAGDADDVAGETAVDVERLLAGHRVGAHHR